MRTALGPLDVLVRAERAGDPVELDRVAAVVRAAFGREDEADLLAALRVDAGWLPHLALVAVPPGGAVVGQVAGTRLDVGGAPAVALAPLSVRPDAQGRGVGSRLVAELVSRARAAGERLVVVLGEPSYYARFGFRPAAGVGLDGPYAAAGDAFQALGLTPDVPGGWVTYPAPFGA